MKKYRSAMGTTTLLSPSSRMSSQSLTRGVAAHCIIYLVVTAVVLVLAGSFTKTRILSIVSFHVNCTDDREVTNSFMAEPWD